jgi:hypothetical protein
MKIKEYDYLGILRDSLDDAIIYIIDHAHNIPKAAYYLGCIVENLSTRIDELEECIDDRITQDDED